MSSCTVMPEYSLTIPSSQELLYPSRIVSLYDSNMDLKQVIADWITEARQSADLSQEALGGRLAIEFGSERGYTKANISHWETKKHEPSIQQLLAIKKITKHPFPAALLQELGYTSMTDIRPPAANGDHLTAEDLALVVNGYCVAGPAERNLILGAATAAIENAAQRNSRAASDKH